jgi:hypothetical protein
MLKIPPFFNFFLFMFLFICSLYSVVPMESPRHRYARATAKDPPAIRHAGGMTRT